MKKEINIRSELILEIKSAYDSFINEVISNLNESFPSRLHQQIENEEIEFHINFRILFFSHTICPNFLLFVLIFY